MLCTMRERSRVPRKGKRERVAPQRSSEARAKPDGLPGWSELVVRFFFIELEGAIRRSFEELLGRPLPPRFTIHLEDPSQQTSEAADRPSPRRTQGQPARPLKRRGAVAKPLPAGEEG